MDGRCDDMVDATRTNRHCWICTDDSEPMVDGSVSSDKSDVQCQQHSLPLTQQSDQITCSGSDLCRQSDGADSDGALMATPSKQKTPACSRHPDRRQVLYCCDCDVPTCEMCFIQQHNGHTYASIEQVAQRLRIQMQAVLEQIRSRVLVVRGHLNVVDTYRTHLVANLQTVEATAAAAVERLRSQVDREDEQLRHHLTASGDAALGQLDSAGSELRDQLDSLEGLIDRCEQTERSQHIYDLPELLASAAKQLERSPVDIALYKPVEFIFTESPYRKYLPENNSSLIGHIDMDVAPITTDSEPTWAELRQRIVELEAEMTQHSSESRNKAARVERELSKATRRGAELTKQLQAAELQLKRTQRLLIKPVRVESINGQRGGHSPSNAGVRGLALLDRHLYVLCVGRRSTEIVVYDVAASPKQLATAVRRLTVPTLRDASDLGACPRQRCLYVADVGADCVHRVYSLTATVAFQFWPVGDKPWGLSVTSAGSLWVCCFVRQKLKEFTGFGQTLRIISLHPDIGYPWHAVGLADGRVVLCHGGVGSDGRRVVAVGVDGRGSTTYGLEKSSAPTGAAMALCGGGQSNSPIHIAVDSDNFVVLVDSDNRRVSLLDPELRFVRDLLFGKKFAGIKDARRVCLDADSNRMYLGEGNGNVSIFELNSM